MSDIEEPLEEREVPPQSGRSDQPEAPTPSPQAAAADRRRLLTQAGWHLAAAVSAVMLWGAGDSWRIVSGLAAASFMAAVASVVFGIVMTLIVHEWCHFAGARASGAISPVKAKPALLMFDFDYTNNSVRQFLVMSVGGSVGNWLLVLLVAWLIPIDSASRALLLAVTAAMAVYVAILEWPIIAAVRRGVAPGTALAEGFGKPGVFRRANTAGVVTAALLWWLLLP